MKKNCTFIVLFLIGCSNPENYEECILKHMEGVKSDYGAKLIHASCYKKHNNKSSPEGVRSLELEEQLRLSGKANVSYFNDYYTGNIYNGNQFITLTEIKIRVITRLISSEESNDYLVKVNIPPLTTGEFKFNFMPGESGSEYSWKIISAKGYKSE